jgi:hypothetical protein
MEQIAVVTESGIQQSVPTSRDVSPVHGKFLLVWFPTSNLIANLIIKAVIVIVYTRSNRKNEVDETNNVLLIE